MAKFRKRFAAKLKIAPRRAESPHGRECVPQLTDELPAVRGSLLGNRQAILPVRQDLTQPVHVPVQVPEQAGVHPAGGRLALDLPGAGVDPLPQRAPPGAAGAAPAAIPARPGR